MSRLRKPRRYDRRFPRIVRIAASRPVAVRFRHWRKIDVDARVRKSFTGQFHLATELTSAGVTPVLKHYPGKLASCTPVASLPGFQLRKGSKEVELCPGAAANVWRMADAFPLQAAPIVMLSNRICPSVSPLPAVLDPVYAQHLRAAGFKGLVISDAIWEISNRPVTVVQALKVWTLSCFPRLGRSTRRFP